MRKLLIFKRSYMYFMKIRFYYIVIISCWYSNIYCQKMAAPDNLDNRLHWITMLVSSQHGGITSNGTGFFYIDSMNKKDDHWHAINKMWLITNRHLIYFKDSKGREYLPDEFTFNLKKFVNDSTVEWLPIKVSNQEIRKRLKLCPDSTVDIVAIQINDLIKDDLFRSKLMIFSPILETDFPDSTSGEINVTDNVNIVGYPIDFYDRYNFYPIVKSGSIASRWTYFFNAHPYFLIDSKLFPGSSGSVVISKPSNLLVRGKDIYSSPRKEFIFLGIFSGELYNPSVETFDAGDMIIQKKQKYDIGIVWYYFLIPDIIRNGVSVK